MNILYFILLFFLGCSIASYAYCQAQRLQNNQSILNPRYSFCDNCNKKLSPMQLFPILGFIIQKGHCLFCGSKISIISTLIEFSFGIYLALILYSLVNPFPLIILNGWILLLFMEDLHCQAVDIYSLFIGGIINILLYLPVVIINIKSSFIIILTLLVITSIMALLNKFGWADVVFIIVISLIFGIHLSLIFICTGSVLTFIWIVLFSNKKVAFIPFISTPIYLYLILQSCI